MQKNEKREEKRILAISWDLHSIWVIMTVLAKHRKMGDHVTIVLGNPEYGTLPYLPDDTLVKNIATVTKEDLGIDDVRFIGAVPLSHFMSHTEEIMLKVTNIVREVKPQVILLEDPDFRHLGWHSMFVTLMQRAIHEAGSWWFRPVGIIGEPWSVEVTYYWWTTRPNLEIDASDMEEIVLKAKEKFGGPATIMPKIPLRREPPMTVSSL